MEGWCADSVVCAHTTPPLPAMEERMKPTRLLSLLLVLVALVAGAVAGCKSAPKADPAAMESCKEKGKASSAECSACCKAAGATGHMWTSGSGCKCL
jgi:hypothetical protein